MASDSFKIKKSLNLEPLSTPPSSPALGDVYCDNTGALKRWDGASWASVGGADTASAVPSVASGNLAATDVQAALDELQSDIDTRATATSVSDHTGDTTDAHDASAISSVASGNLAATDVQAALNELQSDIDGRALTSHNHAGSAINSGTVSTTYGGTGQDLSVSTGLVKVAAGTASAATLVNADVNASAAIELSKLATTTASRALVSDGSGFVSASSVTSTELGYVSGVTSAIQTQLNAKAAPINLVSLDTSFLSTKQTNVDAETTVGDWVAYADAAGTAPVDMTAGSPNTAITRSTSSPLNGTAHFLMTLTTGATRQGEGVSCVVNIPPAYRGRTLTLRFPFQTTGTITDGDFSLYAYDVTNSVVITPYTAGKILGASGTALCVFPVNTTTASIRIGIHVARATNTGAVTILFDDVQVSPDTPALGLAGSNTTVYSMTIGATTTPPTKGTIVVDNATWTRHGDTMRINYQYMQSAAGASGSGTYLFPLPTGYSVDTTKIPSGSMGLNTAGSVVGTANIVVSSSGWAGGQVQVYDANNLYVLASSGSGGVSSVGSSNLALGGTGNNRLSFTAFVPIAGWDSNVSMAQSSTFRISNYLASGSRVTGSAPTALGQYRSYLRDVSANTYTETNGNPTTVPTAADGIVLYRNTAWGTVNSNNQPTKYDIFVGKQKNVQFKFYSGTGFSGNVDVTPSQYTSTIMTGWCSTYDPSTGVATIVAPTNSASTTAANQGFNTSGVAVTASIYADIIVSENALAVGMQFPRSYVRLSSPNGHGSTNTKIRRYTTTLDNVGTAITYADSSTLGATFTINEPGMYAMCASDKNTAGAFTIGITKNSALLTTAMGTGLSDAEILAISDGASNLIVQASNPGVYLVPGDVIRVHTDGTVNLTSIAGKFIISKVSN